MSELEQILIEDMAADDRLWNTQGQVAKSLRQFAESLKRILANPLPPDHVGETATGAEHQPIKCPKCGRVSTTMGNSNWHSCAECGWNWDGPTGAEQKPSQEYEYPSTLYGNDTAPTQTPSQAEPMEWTFEYVNQMTLLEICQRHNDELASVRQELDEANGQLLLRANMGAVRAGKLREAESELATLRRELGANELRVLELTQQVATQAGTEADLLARLAHAQAKSNEYAGLYGAAEARADNLRDRLAQAEAALRFYASTIYPDDGSGRPADAFQRVAKDYFANTSVLPRQGDEFEQWWTEHKDACPFPDKAIYRVIWQELSKIDKARGNPPLPAQSEEESGYSVHKTDCPYEHGGACTCER